MDPLLRLTIAGSLAALFAGSTLHKLVALAEWPGVVRNYRLIPEAFAGAAAAALLLAGALTAGALLFAPTRGMGAFAAAVQLAIFGAAIGINVYRGRTSIDCGCFRSRLRMRLSWWMVVRNGAMTLAALTLLLPAGRREMSVAEIAIVFVWVATLALLYPVVAVVLQPPPPTYDENFTSAGSAGAR